MCLKNKKILIIGGLGFIRRTLLETLIDSHCGAQLFAIDVKDFPKDATVLRQNVEFQNIDIRDENAVKSYVRAHKFDGIVHLAAVSRVVAAENDKKNCIETNFSRHKISCRSRRRKSRLLDDFWK